MRRLFIALDLPNELRATLTAAPVGESPHITLARLRRHAKRPRTTTLTLEPQTFHGTAVTLYASHLSPAGARYEALVTTHLGYIQP